MRKAEEGRDSAYLLGDLISAPPLDIKYWMKMMHSAIMQARLALRKL